MVHSTLFFLNSPTTRGKRVSWCCSHPGEAAGLGAAELQATPLEWPLPRGEAPQRAAAVLQDVGQLGLQPLDGGSCHWVESTRAAGLQEPSSSPRHSHAHTHTHHYTNIQQTKASQPLTTGQMAVPKAAARDPRERNLTPPTSGVSRYFGLAGRKHPPSLIGRNLPAAF